MNTVHITHTSDKALRKIGAGFKAGNQYTGDLAIENRALTEFQDAILVYIKLHPGDTSDEIAENFQVDSDTNRRLMRSTIWFSTATPRETGKAEGSRSGPMKPNKPAEETIVESGTYRNFEIHATSAGRFIVVIYGIQYIVNLLSQVKELIDGLFETRKN